MLQQNPLSVKSEQGLIRILSTLKVGRILRTVGINKSFGLSSLVVFQLVFTLVFQGRNLFRLLQSEQGQSLPGKDVIYRFLNYPKYAWHKFLHCLSLSVVRYFDGSTPSNRVQVRPII